jgi:hypothetical protein
MENVSTFQELIQDAYKQYLMERGKHRVSDSEFARWLGVKQSTFSQWVNGGRTPDYASAVQLARRMGPRVYDVLGFPRVQEIDDASLKFIVDTGNTYQMTYERKLPTMFEKNPTSEQSNHLTENEDQLYMIVSNWGRLSHKTKCNLFQTAWRAISKRRIFYTSLMKFLNVLNFFS